MTRMYRPNPQASEGPYLKVVTFFAPTDLDQTAESPGWEETTVRSGLRALIRLGGGPHVNIHWYENGVTTEVIGHELTEEETRRVVENLKRLPDA